MIKGEKMTYEPVESGHIAAMGYEEDNETMLIRFKSGDEYAYHNVPFDTYQSIKEAPSVGRALSQSGLKGVKI
jgi:hypothetical protein